MSIRTAMPILIFLLVLYIILLVYFRYYEKKGIYFPTNDLAGTPEDLGLSYEEVYFGTADGLKLNAWFIPNSPADLTVLFLHGNAGNLSHRLESIDVLYKLGVNVFIVDWRGYGKSEGSPTEEGLYSDALSSYNYLVEDKKIAPESIVVYGKSLGANVAVDLASKVKIKALICDSGFTSAQDMGRVIYPFLPVKLFINIKYDAVSKIKNIACPKLIIHSRDDEIIPYKLGKKLFQVAASPKQFLELTGSHNEAMFTDRDKFASELKKFLGSL